jgi:hypothetical protein
MNDGYRVPESLEVDNCHSVDFRDLITFLIFVFASF